MTTKQDLPFGAKDQSTGEPIAAKYPGQGTAIVNSYPVTTTDATSSGLSPYATGEKPVSPSGTSYTVPDPQAGVDNPTWVRIHTILHACTVTMPLHPYDGMTVTITDVDNNAAANNINIQTDASTTDKIESASVPGTYLSPATPWVITTAGTSVTYRYVVTSGVNQWTLTAKFN